MDKQFDHVMKRAEIDDDSAERGKELVTSLHGIHERDKSPSNSAATILLFVILGPALSFFVALLGGKGMSIAIMFGWGAVVIFLLAVGIWL